MFYMKHNGETLEIKSDNVYNICPRCGKECAVDLAGITKAGELDLYGMSVYCDECSKVVAGYHRQMETVADEIKRIAALHKVAVSDVVRMVMSGLEGGESLLSSLVSLRMALSGLSGEQEFFTAEEIAAVNHSTVQEAQQLMEERGCQPVKLTLLPEFKRLLEERGNQ